MCNRWHFGTLHRSKLHQLVRNSILDCEILARESGAEERKSKKVARKINCCIFLPPRTPYKKELAFFQVVWAIMKAEKVFMNHKKKKWQPWKEKKVKRTSPLLHFLPTKNLSCWTKGQKKFLFFSAQLQCHQLKGDGRIALSPNSTDDENPLCSCGPQNATASKVRAFARFNKTFNHVAKEI